MAKPRTPISPADILTQQLIAQGLLVEAGFHALCQMAFPNATTEQREQLRCAFFAGAQHLFGSIMTVLEPEAEPTENDLARISKINEELEQFHKDFLERHNLTFAKAPS